MTKPLITILDDDDNCPFDANQDQADQDQKQHLATPNHPAIGVSQYHPVPRHSEAHRGAFGFRHMMKPPGKIARRHVLPRA
jgi:hypothetical protein